MRNSPLHSSAAAHGEEPQPRTSTSLTRRDALRGLAGLAGMGMALAVTGCANGSAFDLNKLGATGQGGSESRGSHASGASGSAGSTPTDAKRHRQDAQAAAQRKLDQARAALSPAEDYRPSFVHGDKPAQFQTYIVMHDTEGDADGLSTVNWWDSNGKGVAAHFIVNKDGSVVQCVALDKIAHHAGYGDTGHNQAFGVVDESHDDKVGTVPIGKWAADYGMNSYSIGIEMVHRGGTGDYPAAQLDGVDKAIAYIDAWCAAAGAGASRIIDHKAWRTGNSDTSKEFASYLANLQAHRTCR